jgi:hypothetical protein
LQRTAKELAKDATDLKDLIAKLDRAVSESTRLKTL